MTGLPTWETIWNELRGALAAQSPCPQHPKYPQVRTVVQGVINDLLSIDEQGILVRSHRTQHEDFIEARRFAVWWDHLTAHGSASLHPGDPNNPHRWRSRIVGAMLLTGLPNRLRLVHGDTIELLGQVLPG
jgi:hypothetical protein